jgi:aminoglycoside phosphotransferase (APT) family kinase protein
MASKNNVHGQDTEGVRQGVKIDVELLGNYVESKIGGFSKPFHLKQFKLGQSNPTFLIIDKNGNKMVVRKKPSGQLLSKSAHAIEREYQVLKALKDHTSVPVPRVFLFCDDASILGTPFYMMEYLQGRIFADNLLSTVPVPHRKEYYYSIINVLTKLHSTDFIKVGLGSYGKNGNYYQRQLNTLFKVSLVQAAVKGNDGSAVGELYKLQETMQWLKSNIPKDEIVLMHGDFKTDNIVFHPELGKVIGVLDWELSTIGHPLFDLANLLLPWYTPSNFAHVSGFLDVPRPLQVPEADELIRLYCKQTNRAYPIQNWNFCIAFAFFRVFFIDIACCDYSRDFCSC